MLSLKLQSRGRGAKKCFATQLVLLILLTLLVSACDSGSSNNTSSTPTAGSSGGGQVSFPASAPQLRVPDFGAGKLAPTVKVLPSVDPSLIVQFPLSPVSIKKLFPKATGLVTVMQGNPDISVIDTVTVDVENMPPNVKFTVFLTEIATKPFGHAEYVGDLITRGDGSGESTFHLITFVAFAADARDAKTTTADQSGDASGIQLEHLGMWFDGAIQASEVLHDPTIAGTPFDGGGPPLHGGLQAMTDGQTLPVI